MMNDEKYIDIAIEISKKAKYPYGAIVVKNGKIIGRSDNYTLTEHSMYSHAELEAIEDACKGNQNLYGTLKGATLYVSCQPCMMCMGAILYEEISKVVYAATLQDSNDYYCPEVITDTDDLVKYAEYDIEIVRCLHREKAIEVLKEHNDESSNRILITGAVLSVSEEASDTYYRIISFIDHEKYDVSSPLDTMEFEGNNVERYDRAMSMLRKTKLIIAEVSTPSTGQGMELQEATRLNIPILAIAKVGSKVSGLVKGCYNVSKVLFYDDVDDIKDGILKFIEENN